MSVASDIVRDILANLSDRAGFGLDSTDEETIAEIHSTLSAITQRHLDAALQRVDAPPVNAHRIVMRVTTTSPPRAPGVFTSRSFDGWACTCGFQPPIDRDPDEEIALHIASARLVDRGGAKELP